MTMVRFPVGKSTQKVFILLTSFSISIINAIYLNFHIKVIIRDHDDMLVLGKTVPSQTSSEMGVAVYRSGR